MGSNELEEALHNFGNMIVKATILFDAVIIDVDETTYTCSVDVSGTTYYNVPLKVLINDRGAIIEIPTPQTPCLLQFRNNNINTPQIFATHKADKIYFTCDNIIFNDGTIGMVKADELKTQLDKNTKRIDDIINAIKNGKPVTDNSGAGLQTSIVASLKTITDKEDYSNIQDTKIKH